MSDLALVPEVVPSLAECEEVIESYRQSYVEAGEALRTIREAKLYRDAAFATFEEYVSDRSERWGFTKGRASQLEAASAVFTNVNSRGLLPPATEGVARELVRIKDDPDRQVEAWSEVIEKSDGKPTAKLVKEVVATYLPPPKKKGKGKPKEAPQVDPSTLDDQARLSRLYSSLEYVGRMGATPYDVAESVPPDQDFRIDEYLDDAIAWLEAFREWWNKKQHGADQ
jgi:hypothetical protein